MMIFFNTCDEATDQWDEKWYTCPVCGCVPNADGVYVHKDPEHLIN